MNNVTKYSTILKWLVTIINYISSAACEILPNTAALLQFSIYPQSRGRNVWTNEGACNFPYQATDNKHNTSETLSSLRLALSKEY